MRVGRFQVEPASEYAGRTYKSASVDGLWLTVRGWELRWGRDEEVLGRTSYLVCVLVGDDHALLLEPEELVQVDR